MWQWNSKLRHKISKGQNRKNVNRFVFSIVSSKKIWNKCNASACNGWKYYQQYNSGNFLTLILPASPHDIQSIEQKKSFPLRFQLPFLYAMSAGSTQPIQYEHRTDHQHHLNLNAKRSNFILALGIRYLAIAPITQHGDRNEPIWHNI